MGQKSTESRTYGTSRRSVEAGLGSRKSMEGGALVLPLQRKVRLDANFAVRKTAPFRLPSNSEDEYETERSGQSDRHQQRDLRPQERDRAHRALRRQGVDYR